MWKVIKDEKTVSMIRTTGKTCPCITFNRPQHKLYGRDNNGKNPSQTHTLLGYDIDKVREMLCVISSPHPSQDVIADFLQKCNEV